MSIPESVVKLVDQYQANRAEYRKGHYNETETRIDFVNPFFAALGWDMQNSAALPETYREVIHEDAIKIGGATKAPDYSFRAGGQRKFFLETKKPTVTLDLERGPAFQLRRYAWTAKMPVSILTNFEEFVIYDGRVPPDQNDSAKKARLDYFKYTDYADKWDELAARFSQPAVLSGAFDKYAEEAALFKASTPVDAAFLSQISGWREKLARNIAANNPGLAPRQLNYAVQMIIDRIIFLRICEDRGIETLERLRGVTTGANTYARLLALFHQADDRYNSGLFHFKKEKGREDFDDVTPSLTVDDRLLKETIAGIYYPESPFEFSVFPADILGHVYEQFLGKVIRVEGKTATVEDKPEVKKAGGVYYTPTYIVDYIVKQTVGKLVEGRTPKQVSALRVLDPACGSGSFLIGAYQFLLDWHTQWYVADGAAKWQKGKAATIYQAKGNVWRLTTGERKRILLNNVYGVDIDTQAVEVTKLSLLLKVLEGESAEVLDKTLKLYQERALPDLETNIKCGNSLIGPDFYDDPKMADLDTETQFRINTFDWQTEFAEIMKNGGFDAVIGNPPYGAYLYDADKSYLQSNYPCQNYQLDSYLLFLERAVKKLLTADGYFGMIIPNPWLTNLLQTSIRRLVMGNTKVSNIVHFHFPVFPKVTVDTQILVLQNGYSDGWQATVTVVKDAGEFGNGEDSANYGQISHNQNKWQAADGDSINIFANPAQEALAAKCQHNNVQLGSLFAINVGIKPYQVGKGKPPQTREIVNERPFDSNLRLDASYRMYLRGSDINRYKIAPLEPRYMKYGSWLAEPRPAAKFDAPEKIVMRQTGDSLVAALDTDQHLCMNNMHVLVPIDSGPKPVYAIGIINSRLLNWFYHFLNPEVGEALAEVKKTNVVRLPIRTINFDDPADKARHDTMVTLVERMLTLNKELPGKTGQERTVMERQIAATDGQIDRLVYALYGLTAEEIAVVEGAAG